MRLCKDCCFLSKYNACTFPVQLENFVTEPVHGDFINYPLNPAQARQTDLYCGIYAKWFKSAGTKIK